MSGVYRIGAAALAAFLIFFQSGCMTVGYSFAKDPKAVGKWDVTITKLEPQNIYNAAGVFWVGPFAKVESRGQRISFVDAKGKAQEIVQPLSDRYELQVGQQALFVADRGQVWVQPVNYPLPPEFGSTGSSGTIPATSSYDSVVGMDLPRGWDKKPVTDQMKTGGTLIYALNLTTDSGLKLSAIKRESVTDTKAFADSREAALVSSMHDVTQSEISNVEVGGRTAYRFDVSGTPVGGKLRLTYGCVIVEGTKEIAYLVAWTSAAGFEKQRSALAYLATGLTGL